jgi:hypothetical protein
MPATALNIQRALRSYLIACNREMDDRDLQYSVHVDSIRAGRALPPGSRACCPHRREFTARGRFPSVALS